MWRWTKTSWKDSTLMEEKKTKWKKRKICRKNRLDIYIISNFILKFFWSATRGILSFAFPSLMMLTSSSSFSQTSISSTYVLLSLSLKKAWYNSCLSYSCRWPILAVCRAWTIFLGLSWSFYISTQEKPCFNWRHAGRTEMFDCWFI